MQLSGTSGARRVSVQIKKPPRYQHHKKKDKHGFKNVSEKHVRKELADEILTEILPFCLEQAYKVLFKYFENVSEKFRSYTSGSCCKERKKATPSF